MLGQADTIAFSVPANAKSVSVVAAKPVLLRNQVAPELVQLYAAHSEVTRLFLWLCHETQVVRLT